MGRDGAVELQRRLHPVNRTAGRAASQPSDVHSGSDLCFGSALFNLMYVFCVLICSPTPRVDFDSIFFVLRVPSSNYIPLVLVVVSLATSVFTSP